MSSGSESPERPERPTTSTTAGGTRPDAGAETRPASGAAAPPAAESPGVMIPARGRRLPFETVLMRLVATAGIVGISVAIGAIMTSNHSKGWVIGLVVSLVSVILSAFLWSSRRL
jgi:hypothetical protein